MPKVGISTPENLSEYDQAFQRQRHSPKLQTRFDSSGGLEPYFVEASNRKQSFGYLPVLSLGLSIAGIAFITRRRFSMCYRFAEVTGSVARSRIRALRRMQLGS